MEDEWFTPLPPVYHHQVIMGTSLPLTHHRSSNTITNPTLTVHYHQRHHDSSHSIHTPTHQHAHARTNARTRTRSHCLSELKEDPSGLVLLLIWKVLVNRRKRRVSSSSSSSSSWVRPNSMGSQMFSHLHPKRTQNRENQNETCPFCKGDCSCSRRKEEKSLSCRCCRCFVCL